MFNVRLAGDYQLEMALMVFYFVPSFFPEMSWMRSGIEFVSS